MAPSPLARILAVLEPKVPMSAAIHSERIIGCLLDGRDEVIDVSSFQKHDW